MLSKFMLFKQHNLLMGKINKTLHLFKHYIGSAVSYICQFPIQILIGKKIYLIALMYLNAFKYETELKSMWNGDSNSVLLPKKLCIFSVWLFYPRYQEKQNFQNLFLGVSLLELYFTSPPVYYTAIPSQLIFTITVWIKMKSFAPKNGIKILIYQYY